MPPAELPSEKPTSALEQAGCELLEQGIRIIPIRPGSKRPAIKNWEDHCERDTLEEEVDHWIDNIPGAGIGLACGTLVAVDVDTNDLAIIAAVESVIGHSPVKRFGSKGYAAIFHKPYFVRIRRVKWYSGQSVVLELIGFGGQVVLPPTIHPDTNEPYRWIGSEGLDSIDMDDLPRLNWDVDDKLTEALAPLGVTKGKGGKSKAIAMQQFQGGINSSGLRAQVSSSERSKTALLTKALGEAAISIWLPKVCREMRIERGMPPITYEEYGVGRYKFFADWRESLGAKVNAGLKPRQPSVSTMPLENGWAGIKDNSSGDTWTAVGFAMRLLAPTPVPLLMQGQSDNDDQVLQTLWLDNDLVGRIYDLLEQSVFDEADDEIFRVMTRNILERQRLRGDL